MHFIRKDGRIIPIRDQGAGVAAKVGHIYQRKLGHAKAAVMSVRRGVAQNTGIGHPAIRVNRGLDALGLGISLASGAVAGLGFGTGVKGLAASQTLAHAMDFGGIAANAASVAGRGQAKDRAVQGAKQEARNFVLGNGLLLGLMIGLKRNRAAAVQYAKKSWDVGAKAVNWAIGHRSGIRKLGAGAQRLLLTSGA